MFIFIGLDTIIEMKKIVVFTSGGDSPGMNACIRAVVRTALYHKMEVMAITHGYEGMINDEFTHLNQKSVANIIQRGGTILKTARSARFRTLEGMLKAKENIEKYGIEGLYDEQRSGRKPILPREKEEGFLKALCDLQSNRTGGRITAADIQNLLKEKFKSKYSVDGIYDLLDRLNIVWITGRSIHPKADKEKQEEFKKKLSRVNKKMSSSRYFPR